jgi:hypothetical protein
LHVTFDEAARTACSPPYRLAEIDLRRGRGGPDACAGSGADSGASQRRPKQRSANRTCAGTNRCATPSSITSCSAAGRERECNREPAKTKSRPHDVSSKV